MFYNSAGYHNNKLRYGTTDQYWNDYGDRNIDDTVPLNVTDYFNLKARDASLNFDDTATLPTEVDTPINASYLFSDLGTPDYKSYNGTFQHLVTPTQSYAGTLTHNADLSYGESDHNTYNHYQIEDDFRITVVQL